MHVFKNQYSTYFYEDIYNLFSKSFTELNCWNYENYFKIYDKRKSPAKAASEIEANSKRIASILELKFWVTFWPTIFPILTCNQSSNIYFERYLKKLICS